MSSVDNQRVIPRPSERRRQLSTSARDISPDISIVVEPPDGGRSVEPKMAGNASLFLSIGLIGAAVSTCGFLLLAISQREATASAIVIVPLAATAVYAALSKSISVAHGKWFGSLLFAAWGLRLAAAVPRLMGGADAPIYQREGVRISASLRNFDFGVSTGRSVPGTGAVRYLSGVVNVFTFGDYLATFIVFVLIAFVGQCAFLLGAKRTLSSRRFELVALLVAFSPTMIFWPSSLGKESVVLLGIGLTVYGASRLYEREWSGLPPVIFGIFAIGMVRPHVAMIMMLALLIGLLARETKTRGRVAVHAALLGVVLAGAMWAAASSAELFGLESLDGLADVNAALDLAQDRTSQDQAQFVAPRVEGPADFPWAVVTVLFRPFPWEAGSAVALLSAAEGAVMAVLTVIAAPGILMQLPKAMQRGQLLLAISFVSVFIFVFSAIGNFGILSRQRSQVVPFVLLLIAIGLAADRAANRAKR